jgi:hypothetical protein
MISNKLKLKIETKYFNKKFNKNKSLRLIAYEIGKIYNDIETAKTYLKQINVDELNNKDKLFLGGVYLNLGLLNLGWKYYKYRHFKNDYQNNINLFTKEKEWNRQNINGKKLYILAEQGIGDCIMWSRYIPLIKNAEIYFYVPDKYWKNIIPLLDYILRITASNNKVIVTDNVNDYDYWIYLSDLTYINNITFNNWLPFYTYIKPNLQYVNLWKTRLNKYTDRKIIGINCTGMDNQEDHRQIYYSNIKVLLDCEEYYFINLNINNPIKHSNIIANEYKLDQNEAFIDTAAIMHNVDIVLTVDTSIVHLAGAMNIKTILLCIEDCEWRWFNDTKSKWYPSVNIFRQKNNKWLGLNEYVNSIIRTI